jgi:hypothetical protein
MIRSLLPRLPGTSGLSGAGVALATALALSCVNLSSASAEPGSIIGSWSGSGSIAFASGSKESARCRVYFAKTGETSYRMSATCATASAKVDQTATLSRIGSNSYAGRFFNQQYNTGGSIRVTVSGHTQRVLLSGEAGEAVFSLRKR